MTQSRQATSTPIRRDTSTFCDPAFAANKSRPIHRWVPWVAGFSAEFVTDVLKRYATPQATVLDPFVGVGTTLVEAHRNGMNSIGFEINPYAALAARIKAHAGSLNPDYIDAECSRFVRFFDEVHTSAQSPKRCAPQGFKTKAAFYSPNVLRKVLFALDFIDTIDEVSTRDVFRLAFAATMVRYSNYSYEPSLGRRVSAGKSTIEDFAVATTLAEKVQQMSADSRCLQAQPATRVESNVIEASFLTDNHHLHDESVDVIITSPPYLNNYHYNRNTRPQLYWLGYITHSRDMKPLEHANFGKYWQTVRRADQVDLQFTITKSDMADRIAHIRSLNQEKGVYGGWGWANYAATYFNDCYQFALAMRRVLKPGGTAVVVLGNSILQGVLIPTDQYFSQIAAAVGLEVEAITIPRATRVGNSIIQSDVRVSKAKTSDYLYEAVIQLKKA